MALPAKNRLTKKKDLNLVFKEGSVIRSPFLVIKYIKNQKSISRFGFIIPIKVTGNAVTRNRLKRVLSESVQQYISKLRGGYDVAVIVKERGEENLLKSGLGKCLANI